MRRKAWQVTVAAGIIAGSLAGGTAQGAGFVAAQIGDWKLPVETVDRVLSEKGRLQEVMSAQYRLRLEMIQEMMMVELLKREAEAAKSTPEALLEQEVTRKLTPVNDAEVDGFIQANQQRLPKTDPQLKDKVRNFLTEQKLEDTRAEYLSKLAAKYDAQILLPEPVPPRIEVPGPMEPFRGEAAAPITLVEFSDFECPYCKKADATIKKLLQAYPKELKVVFRHMPMPFHHQAAKASEATLCAHTQGKFWEFHDILFEHQEKMDQATLLEHAKTLKLDEAAFKSCLESGATSKQVLQDLAVGQNLGITGTPTLFVNGLRLVGAVPESQIRAVIEAELARHKRKQEGAPAPQQ